MKSCGIDLFFHKTDMVRFFIEVDGCRGWTCGTHGGGERCLQGFGWEARR